MWWGRLLKEKKPLERIKVEWVLNKREKMMWSVGNWKNECWRVLKEKKTIGDGLRVTFNKIKIKGTNKNY